MKMSKVGNQTNSQDPQAVNSRVFVGNLNTFQCSKTDVERMFQRYGRLAGRFAKSHKRKPRDQLLRPCFRDSFVSLKCHERQTSDFFSRWNAIDRGKSTTKCAYKRLVEYAYIPAYKFTTSAVVNPLRIICFIAEQENVNAYRYYQEKKGQVLANRWYRVEINIAPWNPALNERYYFPGRYKTG